MAEITEILTKLLERTSEGEVLWKPTADENSFAAVVGNQSIILSSERRDGITGAVRAYALRVLDKQGRVIAELDSGTGRNRDHHGQMSELYQLAKNHALGVDKQLAELLNELNRRT